jgi:hypothetical protein
LTPFAAAAGQPFVDGTGFVDRPDNTGFATSSHFCAPTAAGQLYCWGANRYGQLGDGTTTQRDVPVLVGGGHTWATP